MPESMEAIAVKKSPKMPLWNFLTFFSLFFQMAVDRVKMIFQTPNKGLTCFKHYKFLIFDEKKLPKNFCTTYFKISLVPYSYTRTHSRMGHYFFSYLLTWEVDLIEILEIMAQMWQYVIFLSLKPTKVTSDFILN